MKKLKTLGFSLLDFLVVIFGVITVLVISAALYSEELTHSYRRLMGIPTQYKVYHKNSLKESVPEPEQIFKKIEFNSYNLNLATIINRRRYLIDYNLPQCDAPSAPSSKTFPEFIIQDSVFKNGILAVHITKPLIMAAANYVPSYRFNMARLNKNIDSSIRSDQTTIAVFSLIVNKQIKVSGNEPELWSESNGVGRLVSISANTMTGTSYKEAPILLTFRRRICEEDNGFILRLYIGADRDIYRLNLPFVSRNSISSVLGEAVPSLGFEPMMLIEPEPEKQIEQIQQPVGRETEKSNSDSEFQPSIADVLSIAGFAVQLITLFV